MCDSVVLARPGRPVWIAKNSDREPSEAQAVDVLAAADHRPGTKLRCSELELDQARRTHALIQARPSWMWGCEMGVNEHGLAVANTAVFTRLPVAERGLSSMDMQRLALERCRSADDALELIIELLARHPQGGRMGQRSRGMRYHGSFLLADRRGAWVLETAGELWAAARVRGRATLSNRLTLEDDFDRIHPRALSVARREGWCSSGADFGFARCFGDRAMGFAAGARLRRSQSLHRLLGAGERAEPEDLARVLRDHAGGQPSTGLRMHMTCAHASWLPTRWAGQTTASMIAMLPRDEGEDPRVWMTGTSSPCISLFKPVPFDAEAWAAGPASLRAPEQADGESLWWAHERFHRAVLRDWVTRRQVGAEQRRLLEERSFAHAEAPLDSAACLELWAEHRARLDAWLRDAEAIGEPGGGLFSRYWSWLSERDGIA